MIGQASFEIERLLCGVSAIVTYNGIFLLLIIACCVLVSLPFAFVLADWCLGVRKINDQEKQEIEKNGLIHLTTNYAMGSIQQSRKLLGRCKLFSYSYNFKKTIFFFNGEPTSRALWFNYDDNYTKKLVLSSLPKTVIDELYIRKYDDVILFRGSINLSGTKFYFEDITDNKTTRFHMFMNKRRYSFLPFCYLLISVILVLMLITVMIVTIITLLC